MIWDETDGWIFSEEYHAWQERPHTAGYRPGSAPQVRDRGWYIGLYTVKPLELDSSTAQWPKPLRHHDIDQIEADLAGLTP